MKLDRGNLKFKKGEIVNCIGDGLHIQCEVLTDTLENDNYTQVNDILTGRTMSVPVNQLDRDLQWKRNEKLKSLGI